MLEHLLVECVGYRKVLHTHISRIHHVTSSIIPGIYSVIVCLRIGQTRQIGIGICGLK